MNLKEILIKFGLEYPTIKEPLTDLLERTYRSGIIVGMNEMIEGQDNKNHKYKTDIELCEENINYFLGEK